MTEIERIHALALRIVRYAQHNAHVLTWYAYEELERVLSGATHTLWRTPYSAYNLTPARALSSRGRLLQALAYSAIRETLEMTTIDSAPARAALERRLGCIWDTIKRIEQAR
jgi:hypothetical protein